MSHVFGNGSSVYTIVYTTNKGSLIAMRSPFTYLKTLLLSEHSDSVKSIRIPGAPAVRLGMLNLFNCYIV